MADKLREYKKKRDFRETPEPAGKAEQTADRPRFVIQQHSARRLHWDLRLEHDGALASWALPNGIPENPKENRLAVRTEDHPLEYLTFHGEIPKGQYGAGTMTIWDSGTYDVEKWEDRKVEVDLHGERVSGRYALFPMSRGEGKDWMIHRMDPPLDPAAEPMPEHLVPMLAKLSALPADDERWGYEIKWDGIRAIAYSTPGRLRFESRNLNDVTSRYPELRSLNRALGSASAVLDGEIVAFDSQGRPSFEALQGRMHLQSETQIRRRSKEAPVTYVIFDLLYLDGRSLIPLPYEERRARLEELELAGPTWQTPAYHRGQGAALLEASAAQGLEGVVAKRLDSPYEPGRRDGSWLKVKNTGRQELVIGGWLPGEGRRRDRIGALVVGYFDDGEFRYAGKVGTGFDERELDRLARLLEPLRRDTSPFGGRQPPKGAAFVEPQLVAEIEFSEWTSQKMLRHPSYKGLREDRDPLEVVFERREEPAAARLTLPEREGEVDVEGRRVKLTNLDKVLYPKTGFTKGQVVEYYARIAPTVLPHVQGRPITLKRYPDGVEAQHFYEKQVPKWTPDWIQTASVPSEQKGRTDFLLICELPDVLWSANTANIELHPFLATTDDLDRPTAVAFDLDPGEPAGVVACAEIALLLRDMFERLSLESFVKASGSKGLHVLLPLNTEVSYDETKPFAKAVAELLERELPQKVTSNMAKREREGKVLVDWSQNTRHKSTVAPYSLRAKLDEPTVSMPVTWDEVAEAVAARDAGRFRFGPDEAIGRVERLGDLWAPALSLSQQLPGL